VPGAAAQNFAFRTRMEDKKEEVIKIVVTSRMLAKVIKLLGNTIVVT
jgi:hypothetical protein